MRQVKSRNTTPEMTVRRAIFAEGFRYRLHRKDLPGRPDMVFPKYRIAVFVNGCFWHWHGCARCRMPVTNREYWSAKIARNVERDKRAITLLEQQGWSVHIIWECELAIGIDALLPILRQASSSPLPSPWTE